MASSVVLAALRNAPEARRSASNQCRCAASDAPRSCDDADCDRRLLLLDKSGF